ELKKTVSVIYISHYFGEILDLCDKVTVLKNGKKVSTVSTQGMTIEDLVVIMVGKDVKKQYPNKNRKLGDTVLEVKNISDDGNFKNINFDIKAGEIVGLTGLMGSGHSDIGEVLFGNKSLVDGEIVWKGESIKKMIPEKAVKKRIAYVPEDRRRRGVIPTLSVMENITLPSLEKVSIKGFIKHAQEKAETTELSEKLSIKTPNVEELCGLLSGGNQQKVVIAKWLQADSQLYILNQPTSGVDIGARAEIYSLIDMMAKQGSAVLLISQDIQEIVGLSNRIITIFRGEIRHEFTNVTEEITDKVIVSTMGGSI
ncbi:MAG: ATP-binding cassette domain-containing protein, partial [Oscillospiraceae bacterium]